MNFGEKRLQVLVTTTEHIEMELFTLEDPFTVLIQDTVILQEETSFEEQQEHPLVPDPVTEDQELQIQTKPSRRSTLGVDEEGVPAAQEIEIEMEVFPPISFSESELMEIKSDHSSIVTPPGGPAASRNRDRRRPKWRRPAPQTTGLVVKDVVCIPREHYVAQLDSIPQGKEPAALAAIGMTARITIDYGWSGSQMKNRLVTLFRKRILNQQGENFTFTYLKCLQGSRAWFVPDSPAEGWTGEHVIRLTGHGPLYILSNHDYPETKCGWAERSKTEEVERNTSMGDPFYVSKGEVQEALNSAQGLHQRLSKLLGDPAGASKEEVDGTTKELRNSLRSIEQDLEDLDGTIDIAESKHVFNLDAVELSKRRAFITATRNTVMEMEEHMLSPMVPMTDRQRLMCDAGSERPLDQPASDTYVHLDRQAANSHFTGEQQTQQLVPVQQDGQLELLSVNIGSLKNMSEQTGMELEEHALMLDGFTHELDDTQSKLDDIIEKVAKVSHLNNNLWQWVTIGSLLAIPCVLILLFFLIF